MAEKRLLIAVTTPMAVNLLVLPQLPALIDAGWQVDIVCANGPLESDVAGLVRSSHFIPMARSIAPLRDLESIRRMSRLIRRLSPSVVMGSTPKAGMISMAAARLAGVPARVFLVRGARWEGESGMRARAMQAADRVTVRNATDVLAVSSSLSDLLTASGITRGKTAVLGHGGSKGVDTVLFRPDPDHLVDPVHPVLGYAGRLSVDKGVTQLVEVFESVRAVIPGARLEIVGEVDSAQPIPAEFVRRLRDDPGVTWDGSRPQADLAVRMRTWDVLVFPSRREGLPNVIIEAAACAVPSVAWDVTGVRDAVDPPRTGRLAGLGRTSAMAAAILECLDPAVHSDMREAARAWAVGRFDSGLLAAELVAYLERVWLRVDHSADA